MPRTARTSTIVDLWATEITRVPPDEASFKSVSGLVFRRSTSASGQNIPLLQAEATAGAMTKARDMAVAAVAVDPKRVLNIMFCFVPTEGGTSKLIRVTNTRIDPATGVMARYASTVTATGGVGVRAVAKYLANEGLPLLARYLVITRSPTDLEANTVSGHATRALAVQACLEAHPSVDKVLVMVLPQKRRNKKQPERVRLTLRNARAREPVVAWTFTPAEVVPGSANGFDAQAHGMALPATHPGKHVLELLSLGATFQGQYLVGDSSIPLLSLPDTVMHAHNVARTTHRPVRVRLDLFNRRMRQPERVSIGEFAPHGNGTVSLRDVPDVLVDAPPGLKALRMSYMSCSWAGPPANQWLAWFEVDGQIHGHSAKRILTPKFKNARTRGPYDSSTVIQPLTMEQLLTVMAHYKRRGGYDLSVLDKALADMRYREHRAPTAAEVAAISRGYPVPPDTGRPSAYDTTDWEDRHLADIVDKPGHIWTQEDAERVVDSARHLFNEDADDMPVMEPVPMPSAKPTPAPTKPVAPPPEDIDDDLKAALAAIDAAVANYQARAYQSEPLPASEPAPEPTPTQDTPDPLAALEAALDALPGMHPGPRRETTWEDIYDTSRVQVSPRDVLVPYTPPHGPISDDELIHRLENKLPVDAGQLTPAQYKTWTNWVVDYAIATTPE